MAYPVSGKTYRHKKGALYRVEGVAEHTETKEMVVVYRQVGHAKLLVRPLTGPEGWTAPGRFEEER